MSNVLTVPTVWYFNCPRQCGMLLFRQCGILTLPDNVECYYCSTVLYFNSTGQCGMLLLFRQCGILTVPDNVECSYGYNSVVF